MNQLTLNPEDRRLLEELADSSLIPAIKRRARLLLLTERGLTSRETSLQVNLSRGRVTYWLRQFRLREMAIFPGGNRTPPIPKQAAEPAPPTAGEPEPTVPVPQKDQVLPALELLATTSRPGVEPEDSLAEAGRKILRFHLAQMLKHEQGTILGEDIEELHDMRVATRRMRAAINLLGNAFKPNAIRPFEKGLRQTGRALGRVRDLDVFMEKARSYLASLSPEEQHGLDPLLEAWQAELDADRATMLAHLRSEKYARFKRNFAVFVSTPGVGVPPAEQETGPGLPVQVRLAVPELIYARLAAVRLYEGILEHASITELHALRIEVKRLRYTLEFFSEVLGKGARDVIDDLKLIQDHLGNLHDADVACQILGDFLEGWEDRQRSLPLAERKNSQPVVNYLATRHTERHRLLTTFPQVWEHFNRPELRQTLALAVAAL